MEDVNVGFVGAGQMALALFRALNDEGVRRISIFSPSGNNFKDFKNEKTHCHTNKLEAWCCPVIFLCVKPQKFEEVISQISGEKTASDMIVISVMAGISLQKLYDELGPRINGVKIIRIMTNTAISLGGGSLAYSSGHNVRQEDEELFRSLMSKIEVVEKVPDYQLDYVTGLLGSGPAFIYMILEALSDGAVRMGLPRSLATALAAEMTKSSANMVLKSGMHTGALKDTVTSPGGTTIRGVQVLERGGVRGVIMDAIQAAVERAIELGKQ